MIHDPGRPSKRPCPPKDTNENDRNTDGDEVDSDEDDGERGGADIDRDHEDGGANDDDDESCPDRRTAWLRLARAVLLVIVAVARLVRAL
ncbi:hypothetical protein [Halorubrum tibetense]|uniref:Uncharacterized protein n=1 Tax=Halorubrum tibetense TaxID=175631 RepID=A0ABD5SDP4_9EURY